MGETVAVTRAPSRGSTRDVGLRARVRQYELIRELGRGGMGTVYLARDTKLARRVAIKFLDEKALAEARATARCHHENIVVIHEVDEVEGQPYMVLEYLEGRTLRQLLDGKAMPFSRAVELVVPVVRALAYAHAQGIVHRDLKPENIFVTDAGVVKVLDFGVASVTGETDDDDADAPIGSLPYMAPEQWGADSIDHRVDLWAIGIVLYELVAGAHPLAPATRDRVLEAISRLDDPMPTLQDVDRDVARIVSRCLAKRKHDRIASAGELCDALVRYLPQRSSSTGDLAPYPGLTAFREEDAELFHGRTVEIARLVAVLRDHALVGVVGASGAGKSSLVRAGLVPELKRREPWDAIVTRPGRHPLEALASSLDADPAFAAQLGREPGALGEILRRRGREQGKRILLVVDQFEEIYTLVSDPAVRATYLRALLGASDDPLSPVRAVLALRSDFLDRVATDGELIAALTPGIQFVAAPDRDALRSALVDPLRSCGYRFEDDAIVDAMVDELASADGALPLLQHAASQLWHDRDRERRVLTREAYEQFGGVAGALATHADAVIDGLPPTSRELARRLLVRLVTPERTRDVVEVTDLAELGPGVDALVDQLVGARLVATRPGTIELVHESLIERWPRLRSWLDHSAEDAAFVARVRTAAKQWDDAGRTPGLLWRGDAEQDARRWHRGYRGELGSRERAYLGAVFRLADRASRVRRMAVAGTIALLACLVIGSAVALVSIRKAETQALREATRAHDEAEHARAANEQLQAEHLRQQQLLESLQKETAAREAAATAATEAASQVAQGKSELERTNAELRAALARAEAESQRAVSESERALTETDRARAASKLADEQRVRAEELARKERERAERRGKVNTTLP